jgi:glycogen synthase
LDKKIAFITYETPFAQGGGIAAVMSHLPQAIQSYSNLPTYVISPYHRNISKTTSLESEIDTLATIEIPFDGEFFELEILLLDQEINWVFLKPSGKPHQSIPFFAGKRHPYDVEKNTAEGQSVLLRDALFLGKATSSALPRISQQSSWELLMQDWEAATTILAISNQDDTSFEYVPFLTLHNSYDSGIRDEDLLQIGVNPEECLGSTVLECSLPLVRDPIFTVSEQFARDLSSEILQTEIMIPHIGPAITPRIVGVNNGPFVEKSIPDDVLTPAQNGDFVPIHEWKIKNRERAFAAMDQFTPSKNTPIWGDLQEFDRTDAPWFVMAGRDDSRQKGYELACIAIDRFLSKNQHARFLFFPIPGDEGLPGIEFIRDLAEKYTHYILGFPFLFREGFFAIMQGANYGLMPSYYEPFGMANEYYLKGVGCIGRATGGITQQIVPNRQVPSYTSSVNRREKLWHTSTSLPTGFLFRETDNIPNAVEDWIRINEANYELGSSDSDRLHQRRKLRTIQSMATELNSTLEDACQLYLTQRDLYYEMLINGINHINRNFSWEFAAKAYIDQIKNW